MFATQSIRSVVPVSVGSQRRASELKLARIRAILAETPGPEATLQTAFQPIVDMRSGRIIGAESLARFRSEPYRTPDLWFADAHEAGLGVELELHAIKTALRAATGHFDDRYVAVNVSPQTLLSEGLAALLQSAPADRLVLELTEHARIDDYGPIQEAIAAYRSRGFRLAIDDAGAGYSSFQHILRLRPDIIKLDRALTSGVNTNAVRFALASAMVTFAASLGAVICAEGIETLGEVVTLQQLGVRCGQGYYLGRPGPLPLPAPPDGIWFDDSLASGAPGMAQASPAIRSAQRLGALKAAELMDTESELAFDTFTALASRLLRAPVALLSLVDDKRQFFKSAHGLSLRETPLTHSFCAHAVTAKTPLIIADAANHPLVRANPSTHELSVSAYAGVPILTEDDEAIGAFCVIDSVPHAWSEEDVATLRTLGEMVSAHISVRKRALQNQRDKQTLDVILESSDASILIYAVNGHVERVSAAMASFLGNSEATILKTTPRLVHPDDRLFTQTLRDELLGGGVSSVVFSARFQRADGAWIPRSGTIRLLRNSVGKPERFVVMLSACSP